MVNTENVDILIIGAGPAGLAAACTCQENGLSCVVLDRAGLAQSFSEYPHNLQVFSPPVEMEIANIPLPVAGGLKPTRETYLAYLRGVARACNLPLLTWTKLTNLTQNQDDTYTATTQRTPNALPGPRIRAKHVIVATGMWHEPNRLRIPGENLPHVIYELTDPTPFYGCHVIVVGAGNSAVGGALTLMEAGARVTIVMRRPPKNYRCGLRPFVKRDLGFAVDEGKIDLHKNARLTAVSNNAVTIQPVEYQGKEELTEGSDADYQVKGQPYQLSTNFVFALIGHRPDATFLYQTLGLTTHPNGRPVCNEQTWECSRKNIYVAGSLAHQDIDIILKLREQAGDIVHTIAQQE